MFPLSSVGLITKGKRERNEDRQRENTMKVVNAYDREREKKSKRNLYIFMLLFAC